MTATSHPNDSRTSGPNSSLGAGHSTQRMRIVALAAVIVVAGLLYAMFDALAVRSVRDSTQRSLESVLMSQSGALKNWLELQTELANWKGSVPETHQPAGVLLENFGDRDEVSLATLLGDESQARLALSLSKQISLASDLGWLLLDNRSKVMASSHERWLLHELDVPSSVEMRLNRGEATIGLGMLTPLPLSNEGKYSNAGVPYVAAFTPIRQGVATIGSLVFLVDPFAQLVPMFEQGQAGESQETCAFNQAALLLSPSRFGDQLQASDLIESGQTFSGMNRLHLRLAISRIRGSDTTSGATDHLVTREVDLATRGAVAETIEAYEDYRGVAVLGVWEWLDAYDVGVVAKIDADEAFRTITLMRRCAIGLATVIALAGILAQLWVRRRGRPASTSSLTGTTQRSLGQYDIGRKIGSGGMGTVHLGRHQWLRRDVAVKVLEGKNLSERAIARFEREVQATAKLRHPNTIAIFDYGHTDAGEFFYVMEWVDGITLQKLVNEYGRQPPERVIYLLLQICGSLSEAHQKGIIHRDVKPANVMITAQSGLYDSVKLLDFGLVKEVDSENTLITLTDSFTGTPAYMSPEAIRDAATVDHRSDIYSLGALGYTLLTGYPLFEGQSAVDVCVKQLHDEPLRPSERIGERLPEDIQNVLMSCLRKFPEERPRSVDELAETLQHCADASRWSTGEARRWWEQIYRTSDTLADSTDDNETLVGDDESKGNWGLPTKISSPWTTVDTWRKPSPETLRAD